MAKSTWRPRCCDSLFWLFVRIPLLPAPRVWGLTGNEKPGPAPRGSRLFKEDWRRGIQALACALVSVSPGRETQVWLRRPKRTSPIKVSVSSSRQGSWKSHVRARTFAGSGLYGLCDCLSCAKVCVCWKMCSLERQLLTTFVSSDTRSCLALDETGGFSARFEFVKKCCFYTMSVAAYFWGKKFSQIETDIEARRCAICASLKPAFQMVAPLSTLGDSSLGFYGDYWLLSAFICSYFMRTIIHVPMSTLEMSPWWTPHFICCRLLIICFKCWTKLLSQSWYLNTACLYICISTFHLQSKSSHPHYTIIQVVSILWVGSSLFLFIMTTLPEKKPTPLKAIDFSF